MKIASAATVLSLMLLGSFSVMAQSDTTVLPVNLTLTPVFDRPDYNYTTNIATIQQLAIDTKTSITESLTLGLTRYKPFLQFSVPIKGWTDTSTGVSCMHLEDANVEFGYHEVTVYIANEIPYQSCGFNEIYQHEQKHISVNWQVLQDYTPLIQKTLQDYLNKFGVICTSNPHQTQEQLNETFHTMLSKWNDQINAENHRRQQLVDSPEEYSRITNSCSGQLKAVVRQFVNNRLE